MTTTTRKPGRRAKQTKVLDRTGRRSILTPELQAEFVRLLERGNYMSTVARFLGIGESTVYEWLARGRSEMARLQVAEAAGEEPEVVERERPYVEFLLAIEKADVNLEITAEGVLVGLLSRDEDADVRRRAAVDLLERRYRSRWSRSERQEVTVRGTTRVELTIEEQRERAEQIVVGIVETGAIEALQAQRMLDEGGHVDDDE